MMHILISFAMVVALFVGAHILRFIKKFIGKILSKPDYNRTVYFKDKMTRIVFYHGVNISNYQKHSKNRMPWHSDEEIKKLKEWGFNLVRFLVFWEELEKNENSYDYDYIEDIKKFLKKLSDAGIDVIIDIHQDLYAQRFGGNGFPEWTVDGKYKGFKNKKPWYLNYLNRSVRRSYSRFWKSTYLKRKYQQVVIFLKNQFDQCENVIGIDVMNEPFPTLPFIFGFEENTLHDFYKDLSSHYYTPQKSIPIFYEPMICNSSGIPTFLEKFTNMPAVYIPHYYDLWCHFGKPYKKFNKWLMKRALQIKASEAQKFNSPFIIGEFGIPASQHELEYIQDFTQHMEDLHGSWIWWSYDMEKNSTHALIDNDKNDRRCLSKLIMIYPQRVFGINIKIERKEDYFSLSYESFYSSNIPTEIFIPKNLTYEAITKGIHFKEGQILKYFNTKEKTQKIEINY